MRNCAPPHLGFCRNSAMAACAVRAQNCESETSPPHFPRNHRTPPWPDPNNFHRARRRWIYPSPSSPATRRPNQLHELLAATAFESNRPTPASTLARLPGRICPPPHHLPSPPVATAPPSAAARSRRTPSVATPAPPLCRRRRRRSQRPATRACSSDSPIDLASSSIATTMTASSARSRQPVWPRELRTPPIGCSFGRRGR